MSKISCILLVDDDQINNFINQRLIEELTLTAELNLVNNGLEAVDYLKENCRVSTKCPELILLDINMPVMDGFEFLYEFETLDIPNKEKVKIVMLTTSTSQKDLERLNGHEIAGYINKPLTEEKMLDLVNKLFA